MAGGAEMMELKNLILGFDFGEKESQICCYDRTEKDAVSVSIRKGSADTEFPTTLFKQPGADQWYPAVPEEQKNADGTDLTEVEKLYEICMNDASVRIEDVTYAPGELLAVFLKAALQAAGVIEPGLQIAGITVTTRKLTRAFVKNLRYAYELLGIPRGRAYLQEYTESFYYHTLYQKPELWSRKVGMFRFEENDVTFYSLSVNRRTKPVTVSIKEGKTRNLRESGSDRDRDFCSLIAESFENEIYSSVYMVGSGFDRSWARESVRLLCRNQRHVFGGNNLFARGACFAAREKVEERSLKGYLFLGNDLVRHNIGMEMVIAGSPAYYPMIQAGVNWYEAEKECELILDGTEDLVFVVSDMESGKKNRYTMHLPGLPKRPSRTTRLHLKLEYDAPGSCRITAEDLGFGEMFPKSGKIWHETMGEASK